MQPIKKILFILSLLMPIIFWGQNQQKLRYSSKEEVEELLDWSPTRLSWEDYKGKPGGYADAAAITSTALGMEYHLRGSKLSFKITCRFSKNKSWGKHRTEYILQHEQGHFDITEIFARKLAKELLAYKVKRKTLEQDIADIYNRVMREKEEFQDRYDEGTDYSRNNRKQAEWLQKIEKELEDLEEFANYQTVARR